MEIKEIIKIKKNLENLLNANKAKDIEIINLKDKSTIADFMIIASGSSSRHIQALSEKVLGFLKNSEIKDAYLEGKASPDWKLIDGKDIIIHIFHPDKRKFYELEKMWSELLPKERLFI